MSFSIAAQTDYQITEEMPSWLRMEIGKEAFREREFGIAASIFRKLIVTEIVYPEAEIWLAAVFEVEGEYGIAERQYFKALEAWDSLYILEEKNLIMYKLANLYSITKQYAKYETVLLEIVEKDENYSVSSNFSYQNAMLKTLKTSGINKLIELYRPVNKMTMKAHSFLGIFYYKTGRYSEALLHLLFSVMTHYSILIEQLIQNDPDFKYSSADMVLRASLKDERLTEYIEESDLFQNLYYLAAVLFVENELAKAREIWRMVYIRPIAGFWYEKARLQYFDPFIEPLLGD